MLMSVVTLTRYGASAVKNIVALLGQGSTLVLLVVLYDSLHAFLRLTNDRRVAPLYKFDLPNQRFGVSLILSASSLHHHLGAVAHGASNVLLRKTFPLLRWRRQPLRSVSLFSTSPRVHSGRAYIQAEGLDIYPRKRYVITR